MQVMLFQCYHVDSHRYQVHCAEFLDHMDRSMIPMMNQKVLDLNWIDSPLDASLGMYDLVIDGGVGIGSNRQLVGKSVKWSIKLISLKFRFYRLIFHQACAPIQVFHWM